MVAEGPRAPHHGGRAGHPDPPPTAIVTRIRRDGNAFVPTSLPKSRQPPSYTRAGGRAGTPPAAGPLDGDLLGGDRPLTCARPGPRDRRRVLLRRRRAGINAFTVAFQIPNLVRALVADAALSGAFVPVFTELLESGDRKRAWRVASTLFWLTLLILGGLTALLILLAPLLMRPFGDPGGDFDSPSACRGCCFRSSPCSASAASSSGS